MSSEGDHITLLNVYRAYKGVNGNKVAIERLPQSDTYMMQIGH